MIYTAHIVKVFENLFEHAFCELSEMAEIGKDKEKCCIFCVVTLCTFTFAFAC